MSIDTESQERAAEILERIAAQHPEARVELEFDTPLQLLVATILSAQSTDKRVNQVTPGLFRKYPTAEAFAAADSEELERSIHSTGFFRQKAKSLKNCCTRLVQEHGGEVPTSMEALTALPGVGRKTANVIRAVAFGLPGIAVDTHCKRLSNRLELAVSTDPARIEACLAQLYPESRWADVSRLFIWHGRYTCKARRPLCEQCSLADLCPFYHVRDAESISCRPK